MIHLIIHLVPHLDCLSPFYNPQSGCQQPLVASIEGEWIQFLFSSLSHENICLQLAESGSRWIHLFSLQSDLKEYQQHDVSARFFSFNVLLMSDKVKNWCTWTRSIFFPRPGAFFVEHLLLAEFKATERKLECLWLSLALSALCNLRGSVQISGNMRLRRKYNPAAFRSCT